MIAHSDVPHGYPQLVVVKLHHRVDQTLLLPEPEDGRLVLIGEHGVLAVDFMHGGIYELEVEEQFGPYTEARVALADLAVASGLDVDCPLLAPSE